MNRSNVAIRLPEGSPDYEVRAPLHQAFQEKRP